jgi:hypothetical protein
MSALHDVLDTLDADEPDNPVAAFLAHYEAAHGPAATRISRRMARIAWRSLKPMLEASTKPKHCPSMCNRNA